MVRGEEQETSIEFLKNCEGRILVKRFMWTIRTVGREANLVDLIASLLSLQRGQSHIFSPSSMVVCCSCKMACWTEDAATTWRILSLSSFVDEHWHWVQDIVFTSERLTRLVGSVGQSRISSSIYCKTSGASCSLLTMNVFPFALEIREPNC